MSATAKTANIFLRNDTIFGTCQAIGDDFGFNANWLRVPLAASVVLNPFAAIGGYLALSLLVVMTRSLFRAKGVPAVVAEVPAERIEVEANDDQRELIAA